ncbi:unnamed protein product [Diatraea saccharalis]|uniref:Nucleolar protein 11 n=1 Tax=Diatraea saccharalis TaxID=40085 RepID=A0A9N9RB58_9NEOP|nr:unnamed protein product [Diatraea saccharalis]
MAKLHSYFVLCPLIDQKSFLGVSEDKDPEFVIVTLGRNVINKYRLSDQKQVGGWTSKDHITSEVIYDKEQNTYVGVFNKNTIKIWKDESENLDKIKKYKFPVNILKLMAAPLKSPLIIFENGNTASLPYALENRKTYENIPLIKENENIVDTSSYTLNNIRYVCYVTKDGKNRYEIISAPIREELGDLEKSKITKIKISRKENVYVVGELISCIDRPAVYVLWSDSKIMTFDLLKKSWKTVGSVPWISTVSSVSVAWMGKNHLILFGSNIEQDGAIIVAYNIALGVGSCKYPMKMYTEGARLYCFNDRIILEASNHIGMLPYVLETKRNISSLLGSHEIGQDEYLEVANWDNTTTLVSCSTSDDTKELIKLGLTERSICAQVILPLLEKTDHKSVLKVIIEFKDVPEAVLVQLLNYVLKLVSAKDANVSSPDEFAKWHSSACNLDAEDKFTLLNHIFGISFCDALLIPYLRESLSINDTLFLMSYISFLLVDVKSELDTDYEGKLFDWYSLLMDAFYQQFLITKDEKITNVLENTNNIVKRILSQLDTINEMMPLLNKFLTGNVVTEDNDDLLPYTIEIMQI